LEGSPTYTLDFEMMGEDGDHNTGGLVATGMRIINAIPAVCAAPPGVISTLDLPLVTGRGLLS
jgi:4-hydroxy-tetrahydrodipicolinate reductase